MALEPGREIFFQVGPSWLFYVLAFLALGIFAYGIWIKIIFLKKSAPFPCYFSFKNLLTKGFFLQRLWQKAPMVACLHMALLLGFLVLFLGTVFLIMHERTYPFLTGDFYLYYAFLLDLFGLFFIFGVLGLTLRRLFLSSEILPSTWEDWIIIALLLMVGVSGFLAEAARLALAKPPWASYQMVGNYLANVLWPYTPPEKMTLQFIWWGHSLGALVFIAILPYSKLFHMMAGSASLSINPCAETYQTAEEQEKWQHRLTWYDTLTSWACVSCNRCQVVCPSNQAKEGLSPREITQKIKKVESNPQSSLQGLGLFSNFTQKAEKVTSFEAFLCTTCGACQEVCPVENSPLRLLRNVRAQTVENGTDVPNQVTKALNSLAKYGNPWEMPKKKKQAWSKDLGLCDLSKKKQTAPWLLFAGCTTSLDVTAMPIASALAKIMLACGLETGTLGKKEPCCGDLARRLGENGLFEMLSEDNLKLISKKDVKNIVTASPHCAYTMVKDYPRLAKPLELDLPSEFNVFHYSEFLADFLEKGILKPAQKTRSLVTYHDSCYLGRHRGLYEPPRKVLKSLGYDLVEMRDHHELSLCCGAGGGRMWNAEVEEAQKHISSLRVEQAVETKAEILVTACPLCLIMLKDAVKSQGLEDELKVEDLACLTVKALNNAEC